jgi:hypothetical protein
LHATAVPGLHAPAWHVSVPLHGLLSAQLAPSDIGVEVQPLPVSQRSVVHGLPSLQLRGDEPTQTRVEPLVWQVSVWVQALPSLHGVPTVTSVCTQAPLELQESAVHGLLSSQFTPPVPVQAPAAHLSADPLHELPSSQVVPSGRLLFAQPLAGTQLSTVQ